MYIGPHVNNRYSCQIVTKLEFSWQIFEKNYEIQNFIKIRSATAVPFYSDGQTDMTKVTVSFRNFAKSIYQLTLLCPNHMPHLPTAQAVHFIVSLIMAL